MNTICGIDCQNCGFTDTCKGCTKTNGKPFSGECVVAKCYKAGGADYFLTYKKRLIEEFNSLGIDDMPIVTDLYPLWGSYVNLEYSLPNGKKIKLLDDTKIYLGYQLEKEVGERCYGLAADDRHLLVCEYGCNGANPEIVIYKRRAND